MQTPSAPDIQRQGLSVRNLTKVFGQTRALMAVDLDVHAGSVLGLLGHNGSGKSTLFKILAGVYDPDAGSLTVNGADVPLPLNSTESSRIGLTFVHQDVVMHPRLTVAENFFIEQMSTSSGRPVSWRRMRADARATLSDYGLDLDVTANAGELSPGERTQLAIARAANQAQLRSQHGGAFLMLDEPTVFLTASERVALFALIRKLASAGVGVVLVSHDLTDIMAVTDRVCVLRDGRVAALRMTAETSPDQLAVDIIGTEHLREKVSAGSDASRRAAASGVPVVKVRGMRGRGVHNVSFDLHQGEILGLTGLVGAGFSRILYQMYGSSRAAHGVLEVNGIERQMSASTPVRSMRSGMVLIPGNRREDGLFATLSASENLAVAVLDRCQTMRHVQERSVRSNFAAAVPTYAIRPPIATQPAGEFSGGNQQKILMAKWLQTDPKVVLVDEPTQGVDVGARQEILRRLRTLASSGQSSVLVASSDYEQLAEICDRVIVVARGRIMGQLVGDEVTADSISTACLRGFEPQPTAVGQPETSPAPL